MRLSYTETSFWYGCALRVAGVSAGAVYAAIRMMQWADFRHGFGVSYFERRRPTINTDTTVLHLIDDGTIDAGGLTSLIAGPLLLDRATVATGNTGKATITALNVGDCGWLGQLAEQATKRGLAAQLSFRSEGGDATDLSDIYSPDRTIVGLPGGEAPWWIESDTAFDDLAARIQPAEPAVTLTCVDPARYPDYADAVRAAAADAGVAIATPDEIAENDRGKMRDGWTADDAEWRSLATYGFGVLAESTERSLRSAGA